VLRLRAFDDVTQLELSTPRTRLVGYAVAAYLVRGVLVDTGFPRIGRRLASFLDETPLRGAFVTHQHEDHAGNAALLARRGVPLAMGALTRAAVTRPIAIELYRRAVWGTARPLPATAAPFEDAALRLVATPGHSPDHHAVWDAERETLFAGDLYLGVKVRVAHPAEQPRATLASVRAAAALAPRRLFCAPRGFVRAPASALAAKAAWMADTIGRIEERLAQGWDDAAVRDEVLGRERATGYVTGGEYSHLNYVRAVRREGEAGAAASVES
jgi:glyoxylase-like metal-dependent hydrolase (beta-lactamase superfamily II)